MASVKIFSTRFGEITVEDDRIIEFVGPILGFEQYSRFVILDHSEDSPFKWLQSVDEADLAFVITNPKFFGIDYEFALPTETAEILALTNADDALVVTLVNIPPNNPGLMTANLLGPLVVNQQNRRALQAILSESKFSTKTRLIPDELLQKQSTPAME
ncbi:MAG: flagellar assembly protein FliW [Cyanobacteria bacterium]|nr:flagellar assembly protein FliW [Cyanobacteriota bacterium]